MSVASELYGLVRGAARSAFASGSNRAAINRAGDVCVAQGLPERAEIVRMGYSFSAQIPLANAFTLLITVPTTRTEFSLQNAEAGGGKSYVIDRFWVKNTTSTASAGVITPLSQLVVPGTTQVADNTAVLRTNLSGSANSTLAKICIASTATGCIGDKWNHHQSIVQAPTTNIATVVEVSCYGRYIVPPGGSFNINAQESVSGGVAICGVEWHEITLDLG